MKSHSMTSAKISRPLVPGDVLMRERLFELLDSGLSRPVIWVSGLAGSGKTTMVSSFTTTKELPCYWYRVDSGDTDPAGLFYYLGLLGRKAAPRRKKVLPLFTPEYAMGLDRFAQNFFEELYTRTKTPGLLVFDNVQEIADESLFHQVILEGVSRLPEGLSIVLVSRNDPPSVYSRLVANRDVEVIRGDKMRLDMVEFRAILEGHGHGDLTDREVAQLYDRVDGWVAGVMLMLGSGGPEGFAHGGTHGETPGELFDYFAREVWERVDEGPRDFLMKTSYLPAMTPRMAEQLSGNTSAGRILSVLVKRNLFTTRLQRSPVQYQYHPLFTDYLRAHAQEHFTPKGLADLEIEAAHILAGSGQVEEAVGLLLDAQAWEKAVELILTQAQGLVTQGRVQTLLEWIEALPEQVLEEVPWLSYWKGVCCFQMAKPEAKGWLKRAYLGFKATGDRAGAFLSLAGVCESSFYLWRDLDEIDHWIDELNQLMKEDDKFPSREIEGMVISAFLMSLIFKRPYPQEMKIWEERAYILVTESPDIELRTRLNSILSIYYAWKGDFEKYTNCLSYLKQDGEKEEISPLSRLNVLLYESIYNWLSGDIDGCRESVNRGLELASDTGIHIISMLFTCQMIYGALSSEIVEEAGKYLASFREMFHPGDQLNLAIYHFLAGWEALIRGDLRQAVSDMELSDRHAIEADNPNAIATNKIGLANTYIDMDDHDKANEALNEASAIAERMESFQLKFMCQTGWACSALKRDDEKALLKHLELMMAVGIDHVFCNFPMWRPPVMSRLFAKALEYGIEVDYVRDLIRRRNMIPPEGSLQDLDNWPWPVRVNTLGPFSLVKDNKPVRFSGKAQRRPLDLLKTLIALGGREVSSDRLIDALWPDSDGDMAQNSFNAALHRLRKLIGIKDALTLQDGRLSLDPRYCRVDLWAFEDACDVADLAFRDGQPGEDFPAMAKRAMDLFGGQFLADDLKPWAISPRERTRNKYTRIITRLGQYLEGKDDHEKAIDYYLKALDIDDLAEEVYTSLMGCYGTIGRRAEAAALYERCRKLLSEVLGVEPSPDFEAIYRRIRS